ncbi:vasoactive intestinal polypeptide receptor 2-like [Seriola aureovittata]|uniref:vasoactive intestinal polypeptide receptor 2-like n=1 Tax=Seriola aureovittata TaxID=2871759 RepID=UPI0024BE7E12|nr:vasoactive intestinal polypeptide receptor 2-like [Seriola aureovittata]
MDFSLTAAVCTVIITTYMVSSTHPDCSIVLHLLKKENECKIQTETDAASLSSSSNKTAGCVVEWDGVSCWPAASEDEVVSVHCPLPLTKPETPPGEQRFHLRCQAAVTFFHFCVVSNFWWLLVEALYLQTLLLLVFTQTRKLLWIYAVIGWGAPTVTVVIWALLKTQLEDEGCWDDLESRLWWIIKIPILLSICINFLIFLNSRIIVQKTKATHVNPSETHLYRRLRRCTLLLIPLFGLHYMVFALFPDHVGVGPRLYLELVLGSFQGFIVAVLYCFLNGEVS